jgi:hypothetical protein
MTAPVASGWSIRRVGFAPTGKRRLCTAHANCGRKRLPTESPESSRFQGVDLFGLFRRSKAEPPPPRDLLKQPLPLRSDATFPIPEWDKVSVPEDKANDLEQFWTTAAYTWLNELRLKLGDRYVISESDQFLLLGSLDDRERRLALEYAEKTRTRVLQLLPGIAADEGYGKFVMLVLHDHDAYYAYISNYYIDVAEADELAFSSGMFINHGYGHFVFVAEDLDQIEPVIAHELTHSLLTRLPLPAWVNEGIAVNTERRLCARSRSGFGAPELQAKFAAFWNPATIQEFWSGRSWLRPDDGNSLSYELATTFIGLAAKDDWQRFVAFVNAADIADAGDGAARKHLGFPIANLAEAVLGPGDWTPSPAKWKNGTERGQF